MPEIIQNMQQQQPSPIIIELLGQAIGGMLVICLHESLQAGLRVFGAPESIVGARRQLATAVSNLRPWCYE